VYPGTTQQTHPATVPTEADGQDRVPTLEEGQKVVRSRMIRATQISHRGILIDTEGRVNPKVMASVKWSREVKNFGLR